MSDLIDGDSFYWQYNPSTTISSSSSLTWVKQGAISSYSIPSISFSNSYDKCIDPVVNLGYVSTSTGKKGEPTWSRGDLGLEISLGATKVKYTIYKGTKRSFFEIYFSDFGTLSEDEICRRIVSCELEVEDE